MSSTCFEPQGSSSERRFYVRFWYNLFIYHTCTSFNKGAFCWYILYEYYWAQEYV